MTVASPDGYSWHQPPRTLNRLRTCSIDSARIRDIKMEITIILWFHWRFTEN